MKNQVSTREPGQVVELRSPYALIESAVASGASVDTLERLLALQERYEATQAKKAWVSAMQQFQSIKPELPRNQQVSFGGGKTAYNFCPLPEIDKRLREPLEQCGLSYRFENDDKLDTGDIGVRCIVTHSAGHSESAVQYAKADASGNKNPVQAMASTRTYLMRYTLIAAFALTTADDDDDGKSGGDMPYEMLIKHNAVVRENLPVIVAIKEAVASNDLFDVAMYFDQMPADVLPSLWIAPTKGGIFTTKERAVFKSDEFNQKRMDYFADKQQRELDAKAGEAP